MLKASGDGLIVNVSSIAGFTGTGSNLAYVASKAGIDILGKSLARSLAPEVRVLTVSPGVVESGFVPGRGADFNMKTAATTPLKRVGQPDDGRDPGVRDDAALLDGTGDRRRRRARALGEAMNGGKTIITCAIRGREGRRWTWASTAT